jgi:hypothetical protein
MIESSKIALAEVVRLRRLWDELKQLHSSGPFDYSKHNENGRDSHGNLRHGVHSECVIKDCAALRLLIDEATRDQG